MAREPAAAGLTKLAAAGIELKIPERYMPMYTCKLGFPDGRVSVKEFDAPNADALRQKLEEDGCVLFELRREPLHFLRYGDAAGRRTMSRELLTFNQELLVLLKAGITVPQALDTLLESGSGKLNELLSMVRGDVKGGMAFSTALEKHPRAFPQLYIASIQAGERTGDLPKTISRYIAYLKRSEAFRSKVTTALFYPAILIAVAAVTVSALLIYVVPTFSRIYTDAGSALPLPTQLLIGFSGLLKTYAFAVALILAVVAALVRRWSNTPRGRFALDAARIKTPVAGKLLTVYAVARFTRTLATVLGSGIPIVEALRMSVGTLDNKILERNLLTAVMQVEGGSRLSSSLQRVGLMPPLALRMLAVGEATGSLEEMLADISDYFEEEIERKLATVTSAIEPAIMIVMGLVIGAIIIAMYLPIFQIANTVH